jgi:hypothetical protein
VHPSVSLPQGHACNGKMVHGAGDRGNKRTVDLAGKSKVLNSRLLYLAAIIFEAIKGNSQAIA